MSSIATANMYYLYMHLYIFDKVIDFVSFLMLIPEYETVPTM